MRWIASIKTRFHDEEDGQGLVEYGLVLALVVVVVATALGTLGALIRDLDAWNLPI